MNKVLIIGSGGREHAIGWKLAQSPKVGELFFAPGNGGTQDLGINLEDIKVSETKKIVKWAKYNEVDLVMIGPENQLSEGLVDAITKEGINVFGPTKKAAEIEWSKAFSKQFMKEEKIPTAKFETFSEFEKAKQYLITQNFPVVLKASGLAFGKGVVIAKNKAEAIKALEDTLINRIFGDSGKKIVIEEFLEGFEVSFHVFCDGINYSIFPTSQDHKPIFDQDKGPNTGGMGTIAPVPQVNDELINQFRKQIVEPTIRGLRKRGRDFKGILYPGVMVTKNGPKVLEFNARFGDPEVESYMRLLKTDLFEIFNACIDGTLNDLKVEWDKKFACAIVLASRGYPGSYKKGFEITGIKEAEKDEDVMVFQVGTKWEKDKLLTDGGRVLEVSSVGNTLDSALDKAYKAIDKIHFEGMQFRKDIGRRKIQNSKVKSQK